MIRKLSYYIRQVISYIHFGKRAYVFGRYSVGNPRNITMGQGCSINEGVFILGQHSVTIGDEVTLSAGCMVLDSGLDLMKRRTKTHINQSVRIEDRAWIGAGAIILPGVTVGKGAVVGAGSVVTRDVPPNTVVAGNPARPLRTVD